MKKTHPLVLILLATMMFACSKEEVVPEPNEPHPVLGVPSFSLTAMNESVKIELYWL